jgi:hypothetical protein
MMPRLTPPPLWQSVLAHLAQSGGGPPSVSLGTYSPTTLQLPQVTMQQPGYAPISTRDWRRLFRAFGRAFVDPRNETPFVAENFFRQVPMLPGPFVQWMWNQAQGVPRT